VFRCRSLLYGWRLRWYSRSVGYWPGEFPSKIRRAATILQGRLSHEAADWKRCVLNVQICKKKCSPIRVGLAQTILCVGTYIWLYVVLIIQYYVCKWSDKTRKTRWAEYLSNPALLDTGGRVNRWTRHFLCQRPVTKRMTYSASFLRDRNGGMW